MVSRVTFERVPFSVREVHALLIAAAANLLEARHVAKQNGLPAVIIEEITALSSLAQSTRADTADYYLTRGLKLKD
jgi:hypothetical protein